nr:phosphodiesterase [Orenia metallireducens]
MIILKIGVISDIHGSLTAFKKATKYLEDVDMILVAGDILYHGARNPLPEGYDTKALVEEINGFKGDLLAVKGNVDAVVDDWVLPYPLPEYAVVDDNGLRIVIYHGYQHEKEEDRVSFAKRFGADILIFGHTHQPVAKEVDGVILLNPGSVSLPKQEPQIATFAVIDNKIDIISLEDGKRLIDYIDLEER